MQILNILLPSLALAQTGSPFSPSVYSAAHVDVTAVSATGDNLFIGSGKVIKQLDPLTGKENGISFTGHTDIINSIVIKDGNLFSGSVDGTIKQWDISTQKVIRTFTGHTSEVWQVLVDGNTMFSSAGDESIRIW